MTKNCKNQEVISSSVIAHLLRDLYSPTSLRKDRDTGAVTSLALNGYGFAFHPPLARSAMTHRGFTLAEVLITLAIVGVVAAMTLPNLIVNYQKSVATTRLKKFYSSFQQAIMQGTFEYSSLDGSEVLINSQDPNDMMAWYDKYYRPYFKAMEVGKTDVGVKVFFTDGSGMLIAKRAGEPGTINTHVLFCINMQKCINSGYENSADLASLGDRRNAFVFYTAKLPDEIYIKDDSGKTLSTTSFTRKTALEACKQKSRNCTRLLLMDNWEFKDDYPW